MNRMISTSRPNIIYINADDLGWTDPGFMGSAYHETPNLDRFASEGMVFTNAYAPAANCAPSRACCLTGNYTPRHGVYTVKGSERGESADRKLIPTPNTLFIDKNKPSMATVLRDAGYATCHVGKFHVGADPLDYGFDENVGGGHWGNPRSYFSPYGAPDNLPAKHDGEYLTDRLADESIDFIERHKDTPFFLYLATYTVHGPLQAKEEKIEKYRRKETTDIHNHPVYAAMVESLDENVGRILSALDALGLGENTLVLFTSDNGGVYKVTRQWPLRAGKGSYYEGGIREPMAVRWPGKVPQGSVCHVPVHGVDLLPTFAEAAGASCPECDGRSLIPLLTGEGRFPERSLFWHFPVYLQNGHAESQDPIFRTRPGSAIRTGEWKLIEYFENGDLELYHLTEDVGEKHNLAETQPEKAAELLVALRSWREETRAPVPTELNPEFTASAANLKTIQSAKLNNNSWTPPLDGDEQVRLKRT